MKPIVIKVGGSLYDLPDLKLRLLRLLAASPQPVLLFPGGGPAADAVRDLDRIHGLGHQASHWLALMACTMNGRFLAHLLDLPLIKDVPGDAPQAVVDAFAFASADESRADHWPHHWDVTSDSMAARVALVAGAATLILLKSTRLHEAESWQDAAERGLVDRHFPVAMQALSSVSVSVRHFRSEEGS